MNTCVIFEGGMRGMGITFHLSHLVIVLDAPAVEIPNLLLVDKLLVGNNLYTQHQTGV